MRDTGLVANNELTDVTRKVLSEVLISFAR